MFYVVYATSSETLLYCTTQFHGINCGVGNNTIILCSVPLPYSLVYRTASVATILAVGKF